MSQELELPRPTRIYPSKRDPRVVTAFILAQSVFLFIAIKFLMGGPREQIIGFLATGGTFLLGWILAGTYYAIAVDRLQIRCGCFGWEIPLEGIQQVKPFRGSQRSARISYGAGLSFDAIRIVWKRGDSLREVVISPMEREEFLADLALVAPWIEIEQRGE
jgi:hypothetical protein